MAPTTTKWPDQRSAAFWQAALAGLALLVSGCDVVYSVQPLGEKPHAIVPDDWEGTWLHPDGAIIVAVTDKDQGVLEVGWVEVKKNQLAFEKHPVQLRTAGEWVFGNIPDPDGGKRFLWGRLKKEVRQLTIWLPDAARIKALVANGKLPGRIVKKDGDVVLDGVSAAQLAALVAGEHGAILDFDSPLVFFRYGE